MEHTFFDSTQEMVEKISISLKKCMKNKKISYDFIAHIICICYDDLEVIKWIIQKKTKV